MRLVTCIAAALLLAAPAAASEQRPTLAELEAELVCPTCETTLDQSSSPIAQRMRAFVVARIAAGDTKSEIKRKLVAQFGPRVVQTAPPRRGFDLLAWVLPIVGLVVAAVALGVLAWRWSRRTADEVDASTAPSPNGRRRLDPSVERRLDEELARFDA